MADQNRRFAHKILKYENRGDGKDHFEHLQEDLRELGQGGYRVATSFADGDTRAVVIMEKEIEADSSNR